MSKYDKEFHYLYTHVEYNWLSLRNDQLNKEPCCEFCLKDGVVREANVVDHIVPHKGDMALFSDPRNFQSLCYQHHNRTKKQIEQHGYTLDCDEYGFPKDVHHPSKSNMVNINHNSADFKDG